LRIKFDSSAPLDKYFSIEKYEKTALRQGNENISEEKKVFSQMENLLMISEVCSVVSVKIRDIVNNRTYLKSLFWKVIYSFAISMIFFGGINYALYKISPSNFKVDFIPGYFDFFNYSFFTIFPNGTKILPVSKVAEITRMTGASIGFLLNLLILIFYFTVFNSKYEKNLNNLIEYLERYSNEAQEYFHQKYKNNPVAILDNLKKQSEKFGNLEKVVDMIFGNKSKG
jgi:hypothetical protein